MPAHLQPVLDTLKIFKEEGVWLEITNLVVPTWTDDFDMIKEMCDWLVENELHMFPCISAVSAPVQAHQPSPYTGRNLEKARQIALDAGIKYVLYRKCARAVKAVQTPIARNAKKCSSKGRVSR